MWEMCITRVFITRHIQARDGVTHAMAEVNSRVAETYTSKGGCECHLLPGFSVVRVECCAGKILNTEFECSYREDVTDGIGSLVSWAMERVDGV